MLTQQAIGEYIRSNIAMCTKNVQKVIKTDTREVINMVGYVTHTVYRKLDLMIEVNRQLQSCTVIRQIVRRWLVIRMLFEKWVIANRTQKC
jgi:hypothetical protein